MNVKEFPSELFGSSFCCIGNEKMSERFKPITAITMGDPAGIGPEIVVGTMLSEEIHECCKPFVIGS